MVPELPDVQKIYMIAFVCVREVMFFFLLFLLIFSLFFFFVFSFSC